MDTEKYHVVIDGKPQGPFTIEELKDMAIDEHTFVKYAGIDDYKEAHEIPGLRELFGFKAHTPSPQYFASFDQRLLAMAIDYFLLSCAYAFLVLLSFGFVSGQMMRIGMLVAGLVVLPIAKFFYTAILEGSSKQATIGKKLLEIKVTDLEGNPIKMNVSFKRNLAKILSTLPLFFGYFYLFLNKKQQCWHDEIANTLVIKDRLL